MKPIDVLAPEERIRLGTLQAKDGKHGLSLDEALEVIGLVRKAAKLTRKRIPKGLREDIKRIEAKAEEMREAA